MLTNHNHHIHIPFPRFKLHVHKELKELYASIAIRDFAVFLVAIFEPIYLYLIFNESLHLVFLYFAVRYGVFGLLSPLGMKTISKIGPKHTILLSVPLTFTYFFGLLNAELLGGFVFLLALLAAVEKAHYWNAFHTLFTRFSDKGKRGREVSYQVIILSLVAGVAPIIGGGIITFFGFDVLFVVVLALLLASAAPLFLTKEHNETFNDSYTQVFKDIFSKKYAKKSLAFAANGIDTIIQMVVWPLFLFLLAINYDALGAITTASLLFGVVFTFYIGRVSDRIGAEKLLTVGVLLNAILWPVKMFVRVPLDAFLANTLHGFGERAAYIPFGSMFYSWAAEKEKTRDKFVLLREVVLNLSRGATLLVFALVFYFYDNISITFALASVASLGLLFMIKNPRALIEDIREKKYI